MSVPAQAPVQVPAQAPVQAPAPSPSPIPAPVQFTQEEQIRAPQPSFVSQQPDVIPTQRESAQSDTFEPLAPPEAFSGSGENGAVAESVPEIVQSVPTPTEHQEQIYSNIPEEQIYSNSDVIQQEATNHAQPEPAQINPAALAGNEDYDLSEYIEDTKVQAIALYDYQASAEDEISFDPNDIITHIEMVNCLKKLIPVSMFFLSFYMLKNGLFPVFWFSSRFLFLPIEGIYIAWNSCNEL